MGREGVLHGPRSFRYCGRIPRWWGARARFTNASDKAWYFDAFDSIFNMNSCEKRLRVLLRTEPYAGEGDGQSRSQQNSYQL